MTTPSFNDLGKKVKDLMDKCFPAGCMKLNSKIQSNEDVSLTLTLDHNIDSGKLLSSVEGKFMTNTLDRDCQISEKWTTNNEVQSSLEILAAKNLTSSLDFHYEPIAGRKSIKVKNNYKVEKFNLSGDFEFRQLQPIVCVSSTARFAKKLPLFVGAQMQLDTFKFSLDKYHVGIQYDNNATCISAVLRNATCLAVAMHRKFRSVELAGEACYSFETKKPLLTLCAKKQITNNNYIKTKLEQDLISSIAYSFLIKKGIRMTLGARIDLKNLNSGGHKFGLQVDL